MKHRYLEVTYQHGKPLAAYLRLPSKTGAKAARTAKVGNGLRVDYDEDNRAIGVEIAAPVAIDLAQINLVVTGLGQAPLLAEEWAPTRAA